MRLRAFTLIELLIVIAIITIIAAILFPVFATAREKARTSSCASNEKQWGVAFQQYLQDYDEQFPCGEYSNVGYPGRGWGGQVFSYMKTTSVLACPSDNNSKLSPFSYGYNANVGGYKQALTHTTTDITWGSNYTVGLSVLSSQLTAPSRTVLLFEVTETWGNTTWNPQTDTASPSGTGFAGPTTGFGDNMEFYATGLLRNNLTTGQTCPNVHIKDPLGRHSGGSNFLYCDGHCKWLGPTQVTAGQNANTINECQSSIGWQVGWTAAGTGCSDQTVAATFSVL